MKKAVSDIMLNKVVERIRAMIATKASGDHNHDGTYSAKGHSHSATDVGAAPAFHNHDGTYATESHTHDGVYAPKSHTHTAEDVGAAASNHTHPEKLLYGETLPEAGNAGRIFILKAKETVITEQTIDTVTSNYRLYLVVDGRTISNENMTINYRLGMARVSASGVRFSQFHTGWDIKINGKQVSYCSKDTSPQIGFDDDSVLDITITEGTAIVSYEAGVAAIPVRVDIDMNKNTGSPGPMTAEGSIDMSNINIGGIYIDNGFEWEFYV